MIEEQTEMFWPASCSQLTAVSVLSTPQKLVNQQALSKSY